MAPGRKRSWWPWGCLLLAALPCCGPVVAIEWRGRAGRDFCGTIAVGEPLDAVVSRAERSGLFEVSNRPDKPGPGTRYLKRPLAPFCEFLCIVDHDGAQVTAHRGAMGGLCT
jgi:hypothetical protein